jgi:ubiquinone biosynthesis UbiH/UbiF/VisC/COQ6 family hydroxylase
MSQIFDAVIVGGGLVGTAAAVSLDQAGYAVALVERNQISLGATDNADVWDHRIYAISPGNVSWLSKLGIWQYVDQQRICPIDRMQVWGDAQDSQLNFRATDVHQADLGMIVENGQLQQAAWRALSKSSVVLMEGAKLGTIELADEIATLSLQDVQQDISAKLVIAADGGNSWIRQQLDIPVQQRAYEHLAIVANFEIELPHQNIARQWFANEDIMAWLPLPGNRISIVWSTKRADALMSLDDAAFTATVVAFGENCLGRFKLITERALFPLTLRKAVPIADHRIALVGDAAHQIHALAGQGVNLGFRDVITLCDTLQSCHTHDMGDKMLMRRYARTRATDIAAMQAVTHGLYELFDNHTPLIQVLRNQGLRWVEVQSTIKKRLIRHAMR